MVELQSRGGGETPPAPTWFLLSHPWLPLPLPLLLLLRLLPPFSLPFSSLLHPWPSHLLFLLLSFLFLSYSLPFFPRCADRVPPPFILCSLFFVPSASWLSAPLLFARLALNAAVLTLKDHPTNYHGFVLPLLLCKEVRTLKPKKKKRLSHILRLITVISDKVSPFGLHSTIVHRAFFLSAKSSRPFACSRSGDF